ncbi:TerB family tellurite resistance protein [Thermostichus vulcanus]|uniref:TerB family tellurite resistance protein n=1 Tax=Thermostichus vulcanus str. 'Rupite' TaxID=2813851 RepID=A0ABT0CAR5_THEVL|nr:TerB family tellurite resistance protein [Thermostichus vulcanus]MCJ2542863.1 TerB family tellurite resistance protein [Thermostichus vulcanus str. 'Rupite']
MVNYADLTDAQRQLYLKALIAVARVDGQLDEEETAFFTQVAEGVGLDAQLTQAYLTDEAGAALDISGIPAMRNPVGALILRDLAAMAVVNSELVEKEEALIFEIGKAMQFSVEEVNEFLDWAFMGLQWQLKSAALLERYA